MSDLDDAALVEAIARRNREKRRAVLAPVAPALLDEAERLIALLKNLASKPDGRSAVEARNVSLRLRPLISAIMRGEPVENLERWPGVFSMLDRMTA